MGSMSGMMRVARMAGALAAAAAASAAWAQEKVTFNMSWLPQGSIVGVAVAQDKGWFREAGLDVNIVRGYGGNRTANELDQGQFEFGYVDPISLVLNRSNGGRIRMIGAINTEWPAGICFMTGKLNPKGLDDLKGLAMGGGSASPVHNVVPTWLEKNGKPRDMIRMLRMDPAVVDASLVEGKIDLAECWRASNRAVLQKRAKAAGSDVRWIEYRDFGLNAYGSGFAAREDYIAQKPDVVRRFLRESYRGYQFAAQNPDQAADIMLKMFPTIDRDVALQQIREISELLQDKDVRDRGLGFIREDRMKATVGFVDSAFDLKGKVKVEDTFTNSLLK